MRLLRKEFYRRFSFPNARCLCNSCLFITQIKLCLCYVQFYDFFLSVIAVFKEPPYNRRLSLRGINDVRQTEVHTAEPLEPQTAAFDFEMSIEELKRYTSPLLIKFQQN